MSKKILNISLNDDYGMVDDTLLSKIEIDQDRGTIEFNNINGERDVIAIFKPDGNTADDYMRKDVYVTGGGSVNDANNLGGVHSSLYATKSFVDGIINNIESNTTAQNSLKLGGFLPSYYASLDYVNQTFGDMKKNVYDTNGSGVVDNAERLGGLEKESFYVKGDEIDLGTF